MRVSGTLAGALASILALAGAAGARADIFGPISLASRSTVSQGDVPPQQADYAHDPAISGDGRYVVFDGSFGGVSGVWRRDLASGEVLPVAVGQAADAAIDATDAELPSISYEGRYVSFTTTARLDPVDDLNSSPDVYVRDMDVPVYPAEGADPCPSASPCNVPAAPGAFTLVSAQNGSSSGLSYLEGTSRLYGSVAAGRSAISSNGNMVAFVTTAVSNLNGEAMPETPALQVAVRDIDSRTTTLVSVRENPATGLPATASDGREEPVFATEGGTAFGAVFAGAPPPRFQAPSPYGLTPTIGASISADGSTVAWMGQDVGAQVPELSGEGLRPHYTEPLWRRIDEGPQAPTRRVTGGPEPGSLACAASGETALMRPPSAADPCAGPFQTEALTGIESDPLVNTVPMLSENGETVAFLATAPPLEEGDFGLGIANRPADVYVSNMSSALPRARALRPLSEIAGGEAQDPATDASIVDFALSPDGHQVAFSTQRTVFPLGAPAYVSAPAASVGLVELFDADLSDETLTRVTQGFEGGQPEHPHKPAAAGVVPYTAFDGSLSPSFSANGLTLAFSSTASNLVYGDGNTPSVEAVGFDGSDAFVVSRQTFGSEDTPQEISAAPAEPLVTPNWAVYLNARSLPDGSVQLQASAPAAGSLTARAIAPVLLRPAQASRRRAGARSPARGSSRSDRAGRHAAAAQDTVRARTVARASAGAQAAGEVDVLLRLTSRYAALAARRGGLSATVQVSFAGPGGPVLHARIPVAFVRLARHRAGRLARARGGAAAHTSKRPGHGGRR